MATLGESSALSCAETAEVCRCWLLSDRATDGAAHTVAVLSLSQEVLHFLPVGEVLNWILLNSTDFSLVASHSL